MLSEIRIVFDNKTATVTDGARLVFSGTSPQAWSFAKNVATKPPKEYTVLDKDDGHKHITSLFKNEGFTPSV